MVSWAADGGLAGFSAQNRQMIIDAYKLASPGTVDVNGITRLQYPVNPIYIAPADLPTYNRLGARATITFSPADVTNNPGKVFGLTMFAIASTAFAPGVVPTPAQILAQAGNLLVYRATTTLGSLNTPAAGTQTFTIPGPPVSVLTPNTKYWVLVMPTAQQEGMTPSTVYDTVPSGNTANALGRALSVWTNRPPDKPVITSPPPNSSIPPGTSFKLQYASKDPDKVTPDFFTKANQDLAGVQFQFSPAPTEAVPDPPYSEMIFRANDNTQWPAAFILGQSDRALGPGRDSMINEQGVTVLSGDEPATPKTVPLPSGKWRIRARTFDFGHPYPDGLSTSAVQAPALGDDTRAYRANTYPALNRSDWSEPLLLTVLDQATPPLPLYPALDVAAPQNAEIVFGWQYRNAYQPPYPQQARDVQIRAVGDGPWTTVVSGNSASPTVTVSAEQPSPPGVAYFPFVFGTRYEWRVRTTDTDGALSEWSEPARFWVVATPGSGSVVPLPGSTIEGATLGCGTHTVEIFRRGGKRRVGEIRNISYLDYNRIRDDISTSKIVVSGWDIDCGNLLARLKAWAYEIRITRHNGFSDDRVWEGPITLLTYENDKVTIQAKDVMNYAYRRIIKQPMVDTGSGDTVTGRAIRVLQNALGPDDPNVLPYLTPILREDDSRQYRSTPAYARTAFEEVDDMASNAGLDYTVVGRRIIVWGTKNRIGAIPEFKDRDLGNALIVSEYGMSMANRYVVSDGNGVWGEATRLNADGLDPNYGLVEMLSSTWASDSTEDSGTYTEAGRAKVKESFEQSSERSIDDRYLPGAPVVVRLPDNSTLNPSAVVSIQHLVPGVSVPLVSNATLRTVKAVQRLDSMKVTEQDGSETINITLSSFGGIVPEEEGAFE